MVKNTPHTSNSNFIKFKKKLTKKEIKKLQLKYVFSFEELKDKKNLFQIECLLNLSNNFQSVIINSKINQKETSSIIVNYDKNDNFIDYKLISYHETINNMIKTESIVYTDSITSKEYNLFSKEAPLILNFKIKKDGKIIRK